MWGRGAADMKGGVAAMVYAVRALRDAGARLGGDLSLVTVIEEECTGNGALSALDRGYTADAAVIPEPLGDRHSRHRSASPGLGTPSTGRVSTPSARPRPRTRWSGRARDRAVASSRPAPTATSRRPQFAGHPHPLNYNVGIVRGGDWASWVPEECVLEVRIGLYPGEDMPASRSLSRRAGRERPTTPGSPSIRPM